MKISIITATYNSIQHISGLLASISKQSYHKIELIVIDGGSTDGTVDVLKHSNLISHLVSEKDNGIYDAMNKGICLATGDIIGFLNSDDLLSSPDTLRNIVDSFKHTYKEETLCVDGVYGDLTYVNRTDTKKVIRYWESCMFKPSRLKHGWMPAHPSLYMRREVYEKHGMFDLKFKISADYDLMLRIFKDNSLNFVYLPEVITKMRVGGVSNRNISNILQKSKEDYWAISKNHIPFPILVLFLKNISKVFQFFSKQKEQLALSAVVNQRITISPSLHENTIERFFEDVTTARLQACRPERQNIEQSIKKAIPLTKSISCNVKTSQLIAKVTLS